MYCPNCRADYRPGFHQCSDCNIPLVHELPLEAPHHDRASANQVVVFESAISGEADMVAAALEQEGILGTTSRTIAGGLRLGIIDPGFTPGQSYTLSVPCIAEERARDLIASLRPSDVPDPPPLEAAPDHTGSRVHFGVRRARAIAVFILLPVFIALVFAALVAIDFIFM